MIVKYLRTKLDDSKRTIWQVIIIIRGNFFLNSHNFLSKQLTPINFLLLFEHDSPTLSLQSKAISHFEFKQTVSTKVETVEIRQARTRRSASPVAQRLKSVARSSLQRGSALIFQQWASSSRASANFTLSHMHSSKSQCESLRRRLIT